MVSSYMIHTTYTANTNTIVRPHSTPYYNQFTLTLISYKTTLYSSCTSADGAVHLENLMHELL